jgi:hypothetical protein
MFSSLLNPTHFKIIGIYPIRVTQDSINEAIKYHMFDWMADDQWHYTLPIRWNAFENLVLVELQWSGKIKKESVKSIYHKFEVPYMPFYLSADGTELINEKQASQTANRRICFFLHGFDISQPIIFGKKKIKVAALSDLPYRLQPFTHYVPVEDAH